MASGGLKRGFRWVLVGFGDRCGNLFNAVGLWSLAAWFALVFGLMAASLVVVRFISAFFLGGVDWRQRGLMGLLGGGFGMN